MTYPETVHDELGLPFITNREGFLRYGLGNVWLAPGAEPWHLFHSPRICPFVAVVYVDDEANGRPMAVLGPAQIPSSSPCLTSPSVPAETLSATAG